MECFMDIDLRPDAEFAAHLLLGALFDKLHRALATNNGTRIAVCFPGYQTRPPALGTRMRLLGSRPALQALTSANWLTGIYDHVRCGALAQVPADATHRTLRRVQAKSSPERLRRRLMKRHDLDEMRARDYILDSAAETLNLPFVQLRSRSTGQTFRLFLKLGPEQQAPSAGEFNTYGLSQNATVPWF